MRQLSDEITRKFTDSIDLDEWEIETEDGWKPLISINKTIPYSVWRLETKKGLWFEGADDHIVILENGEQCFIKDLVPGQSSVTTKSRSRFGHFRPKPPQRRRDV